MKKNIFQAGWITFLFMAGLIVYEIAWKETMVSLALIAGICFAFSDFNWGND